MNFNEIKTLTIVENKVSIDGEELEITTSLDGIDAVQFHKGRDYCFEEPSMEKVALSKYQYALEEYETAKELIDNPPYVEPTIDELKQRISEAIQLMLDSKAQEFRYDNINSIGKYLGYDNAFRSECEALGKWASDCWVKASEIEATGTVYTTEEVLALMPTYE